MMSLRMCDNCAIAMPEQKLKYFWHKSAVLCPDCHRVRWRVGGLQKRRPDNYNTHFSAQYLGVQE